MGAAYGMGRLPIWCRTRRRSIITWAQREGRQMKGILGSEKRGSLVAVGVLTFALLIFSFVTTHDPGNFGITVLSGLLQGMLLFLVASGLSIVFGLMDVLNFAQGAYFMVGA